MRRMKRATGVIAFGFTITMMIYLLGLIGIIQLPVPVFINGLINLVGLFAIITIAYLILWFGAIIYEYIFDD